MTLSERIRAGSEAAPWVVEAVAALEAENAALKSDNTNFIIAWKSQLNAAGLSAKLVEQMVNQTAAQLIAERSKT